jgi:hypothetical protein
MSLWSQVWRGELTSGPGDITIVRRAHLIAGLLVIVELLGAIVVPARAVQQVKSLYSAIDPETCSPVELGGREDARLCEGLPGYPVYLSVRGGKTYASAGPNARLSRAAGQTLAAENSLHTGGARPTVEWRFTIRDEKPVPYAMIIRYVTRSQVGEGEVLVVTRLAGDEACHVAYVDALANGDPMVLARKVADTEARGFSCESEPRIAGAHGRSPM